MKLYTIEDITDLFKVTRRSVYKWIDAGKLSAFKVGKEWRITEESLQEFITNRGTGFRADRGVKKK